MDDPFWLTCSIQYVILSKHIGWHISIHFRSAFPFYTPWKYNKSRGFLLSLDRGFLTLLWGIRPVSRGLFLSNILVRYSFKYFFNPSDSSTGKSFPWPSLALNCLSFRLNIRFALTKITFWWIYFCIFLVDSFHLVSMRWKMIGIYGKTIMMKR